MKRKRRESLFHLFLFGLCISLGLALFASCNDLLSGVQANTYKDISAFSFTAANNSELTNDAIGVIAGTEISVVVPGGTDKMALVATFTTTGASVTVDGKSQVSGTTQNEFSGPVTYRVTAKDNSTKDYQVTVYESGRRFLSFGFPVQGVTGRINEGNHTIEVVVPIGTDLSGLVAEFNTTGVEVTVGPVVQSSGVTANNFNSPVTYTVAAEDGSTQDYVVTVEHAVLMGGSIQGIELNLDASVSTLKTCATFSDLYDMTSDGTSLYVADHGNHTIRRVDIATGRVTTLAGSAGDSGTADGVGSSARFAYPSYLTTDGTDVYVCDGNNAIRKIAIATGEVTTFAGKADEAAYVDGTGTDARFYGPHGITNDGTYLYLLDYTAVRKISIATAEVTTFAGSTDGYLGHNDGTGFDALFDNPRGITIVGGVLYIADTLNYTIRKLVISTAEVTTIAGSPYSAGTTDGIGSAARFEDPWGIATDGTNLYVADRNNETIRKIVISTAEVSTLAGEAGTYGYVDLPGTDARFDSPHGIYCDDSILYVADRFNYCIRRIRTSDADVRTFAGSSSSSGVTDGWGYPGVRDFATDGDYLYCIFGNCTIQRCDLSTGETTVIAGRAHVYGSDDGTGTDASFNTPVGITTDGTDLFVCDYWSFNVRKVDGVTGEVTTVAGLAGNAGTTDGIGSAARFFVLSDITWDGNHLYVVENANHTIRKIDPSTQEVTTFAGSAGSFGSSDGIGSAARFNYPSGITTDGTNLYVTDGSNHTIRKIVIATTEVSTLAGSAGSAGSMDGTGSAARFSSPSNICTDGIHLYISDGNHTVRKLTIATAAVTTIAGAVDISALIDGTGSSARFLGPGGVTTNGYDLYIADGGALRKME